MGLPTDDHLSRTEHAEGAENRRGVVLWHPLLPGSLAGAERLGDWLRRFVYMLSDKQCMCAVA